MPDDQGTTRPAGEPTGDESGRERLLKAMFRPSRGQLMVAVLLAIVGFAGIVQIRATNVDDTYAGLREQELIRFLESLSGTTQRTQSEIADLNADKEALQSETQRRRAAVEQAQTEADNLAILAGQVPVTGPGIRVTIREPEGTLELSSLLDTIQELRASKAEAMQINGQVRVVAQSSFESAVGGFVIDGQMIEPPYVIDVIGLPATLAGAVDFPLGPRAQIVDDGATVEVEQLTSVDITSVVEPARSEYAEPE